MFCLLVSCRPRPPRSRSTPSGRLCPNWETSTSTMPLARLTGPTGEPGEHLCYFFFKPTFKAVFISSASSSPVVPWWEWIFLRRPPASWWRRSSTTLLWLWRNLRDPSWPSSEGEKLVKMHPVFSFTSLVFAVHCEAQLPDKKSLLNLQVMYRNRC